MMRVVPCEAGRLGAEIRGIDLRTVDDEGARLIQAAVHRHALVRLKDQALSVPEFVAFGSKLGTHMVYPDPRYHHPEFPEVFVSSNVKGRTMGMGRSGYFWHTDQSFKPKPQPLTLLYPQLLPQARRETLFVNMGDIYDRLPIALRSAIEGRTAKHDPVLRYKVGIADVEANLDLGELIKRGRAQFPAPTHPCVITHPVTKRKIVYMNQGFTTSIDGLAHEESEAILEELFAFTERAEHVQAHSWVLGELIIWDNRILIHRAGFMGPGDYQTIFRLNIDDGVPFYEGIAG
jgi:taurine dioxygenase